ncbi:MATH and LRR domain-containing protein PFE0570w-like isoform X3 [Biomphalaria glabrata]|nr:MATH and LRR domain-containing protein PFE0570w-like isoform X3 [Biomphalaria glabrata]
MNCDGQGCVCVAPGRCVCSSGHGITKREVNKVNQNIKGNCIDLMSPCSHKCLDLPNKTYTCSCNAGYILNQDKRTCDKANSEIKSESFFQIFPELQLNSQEKEEINKLIKDEHFLKKVFSDIIFLLWSEEYEDPKREIQLLDYVHEIINWILMGNTDISKYRKIFNINKNPGTILEDIESKSKGVPQSLVKVRMIIILSLFKNSNVEEDKMVPVSDKNMKENDNRTNNRRMNLNNRQLNDKDLNNRKLNEKDRNNRKKNDLSNKNMSKLDVNNKETYNSQMFKKENAIKDKNLANNKIYTTEMYDKILKEQVVLNRVTTNKNNSGIRMNGRELVDTKFVNKPMYNKMMLEKSIIDKEKFDMEKKIFEKEMFEKKISEKEKMFQKEMLEKKIKEQQIQEQKINGKNVINQIVKQDHDLERENPYKLIASKNIEVGTKYISSAYFPTTEKHFNNPIQKLTNRKKTMNPLYQMRAPMKNVRPNIFPSQQTMKKKNPNGKRQQSTDLKSMGL